MLLVFLHYQVLVGCSLGQVGMTASSLGGDLRVCCGCSCSEGGLIELSPSHLDQELIFRKCECMLCGDEGSGCCIQTSSVQYDMRFFLATGAWMPETQKRFFCEDCCDHALRNARREPNLKRKRKRKDASQSPEDEDDAEQPPARRLRRQCAHLDRYDACGQKRNIAGPSHMEAGCA